ncbi:hypothetical protein [Paenibacillus sp. RC67]|uniref:hypothetical protein n=1 Tax=Paenibacillus sp. RC67 TaxID=3039392 RepID=UPI0024AD73BE|nr:hypothetical protein [Paenibacillus sp. RC67]
MIAELFGEIEKVVSVWKQRNGWNVTQQSSPKFYNKTNVGVQPDNKNTKGDRGGHGGPSSNDKVVKHVFFSRITG